MLWIYCFIAVTGLLVIWAMLDIRQTNQAIRHNFPITGHFGYWLMKQEFPLESSRRPVNP